MKAKYKWISLFSLTMLLLASCIDEDIVKPQKPQEQQVTFTMHLPRSFAAAPGTGLTEEQEREISNLTILLFTDYTNGSLKCEALIENLTPTPVPGTNDARYTVTVPIPVGNYRIMLLANVPRKFSATNPVGMLLPDIESTLLHEMQAKWNLSTHAGFPMWGMTPSFIMITGSSTLSDPILMLRMLSRINITVDDAIKEDFKINTIRLHNPSSRGLVIPAAANLDDTTTPGYLCATAPSLPLNSAGNPDPGLLSTPWAYDNTEIDEGNYCLNTIYALEGFHPQGRADDEYAWLEVTFSYAGQPEEQSRIDLLRTLPDGTREPIGLLRNHTYDITILSLSGESDLEFRVIDWNDSDMSDIIFEGKYYLKVNNSDIQLDREAQDSESFNNKLTIETNYEDGWEVGRVTQPNDGAPIDMDNGWIQIRPTDRSGPQGETTIPIYLEENTSGATRSAEIHLQVGRLIDFIVTVTQQDQRIVELYIEDPEGNPLDEIIFYDYYGNNTPYEAKPFRVRWAPHGTNSQGVNFSCDVRISQVGDNVFTFKAGTEQIQNGKLTDVNGVKEYTVEPEKFTEDQVSEFLGNPFRQHASWITFTVTDPDNATNSVSKTIYLNYQHLAIISRNFRRLSYLNRNYTFDVLSNTRWVVESITNNDGVFTNSSQVGSYGGNDVVNGQPLTYTMANANLNTTYMNGMGQAGRKATFYLRDQRGIIPDLIPFTVSAVYEDPNCYIVNPPASGSTTLRIPIRKLFWIREREADDPTVTDITSGQWAYRTVWEEYYNASMNPINGYSISIDRVAAGSHVLEDMLQITIPARSGGVNGNILVGVHRPGENTYLWSWHIWLTDYNPDATNGAMEVDNAWFMRRNIGALSSAELLNDRTTGFYYQWGRKDPLRPTDITGNRMRVNETKNLKNAIDNPRVFYYSDIYPLYDWYTKETLKPYQDDFLWNEYDDHKSQYDPCPAGWRIPNLRQNETSGSSLWRETVVNQNVIVGNALQGFQRIWRDHTTGDHIFTPANGAYDQTGLIQNYGESSYNYNANPFQEELKEFQASFAGQAFAGGFDEQGINRASAIPVRCVKRK